MRILRIIPSSAFNTCRQVTIIESLPRLPPELGENKVSTGRTIGGSEGEVLQGSVLQCRVSQPVLELPAVELVQGQLSELRLDLAWCL